MTENIHLIILITFGVMNLIAFLLMGIDKAKAKCGAWRIKESVLFTFAVCLGGVGATLGMFVFRHKTKHWYFRVFFPFFAITSIAVTVLLIIYC